MGAMDFRKPSQKAFNKWHDEYIRDSKYSNQDNLPSSQLPPLISVVVPQQKQLFVLIDTCSLVKHQADFVDFVTNLRASFRGSPCPIRFIIPLVVLEELDKCNRKSTKKRNKKPKEDSPAINVDNGQCPPIDDLLNLRQPPRSFMRIVEEEVRTLQIIVPDLDPERKFVLTKSLSSAINDNRILDSCLRSKRFIESHPHHEDTRVILVTEDNNFKTKATTFQVPSFRWLEFVMKYRNFGKKNCVETPHSLSKENTFKAKVNGHTISSFDKIQTPKLVTSNESIQINPLPPYIGSQEIGGLSDQSISERKPVLVGQTTLGKLLPTKLSRRQVNYTGLVESARATSQKVTSILSGNVASKVENLLRNQRTSLNKDDVTIVKEDCRPDGIFSIYYDNLIFDLGDQSLLRCLTLVDHHYLKRQLFQQIAKIAIFEFSLPPL